MIANTPLFHTNLDKTININNKMHFPPFTEVLGSVVCQTMSKYLGIESAERSWSDMKTIKNGKWSNIGGD